MPIYELLGGKVRDKVKVYAWIGGDRPADVLDQAYAGIPFHKSKKPRNQGMVVANLAISLPVVNAWRRDSAPSR